MANLVILESPHKATTVKGYLGSGYKVMASDGHVRDLPKSRLAVDVDHDFAVDYINIRGKGELIRSLKKEAKAAKYVYLATDPDREGEAISWHLATALDLPAEKVRRVTFNEITKTAVKAGMKAPRAIDIDLVNSQQARRILDRIVGYKLSPFLWRTVRSGLSAGRVQSVATRVIVDRENEIRAFVPQEYYTLSAVVGTSEKEAFTVRYAGGEAPHSSLATLAEAEKIVAAIGEKMTVDAVKKAVRQKAPQPPFITSTLQQEANRRLGFQTARTMRIAQELYEGIDLGSSFGGVNGLISYMRTDSLRISAEAQAAARAYLTEKYGAEYVPEKPREYKSRAGAQDAHEAIRPSDLHFVPEQIKKYLTADQFKLYRLIWNRFLASQMANAKLDTLTIELSAGGYPFRASGYTVRFPGYSAVLEDHEEEGDAESGKGLRLPALTKGERLHVFSADPKHHTTEPPARYTEASLIRLFEESGIGRPSTYATIISTILSRGYVVRDGKAMRPTELGEQTNTLMTEYFPKIVDLTFTAGMEKELDEIANGKTTVSSVLSGFYKDFAADLANAEEKAPDREKETAAQTTDLICEKCGAVMVVKIGRYGKFAACPNYPACRNTKPLTDEKEQKPLKKTGEKCELCGADMVIRPGRYGNFYACSRYPECKNTKQIRHPVGVKCPKCGGEILQRSGKNRRIFYSCENYPTCDFSSWDLPLRESCPRCGKLLFAKKGKNLILCHDRACGYKREMTEEEVAQRENMKG
mgnify:FL=1